MVIEKKTKPNKKERRRLQSIEEGSAEGGATEGTKIQDIPHTKKETSGLGDGKLETNKSDKPEQKEKTTGSYSKSSAGIKSEKFETTKPDKPEQKEKTTGSYSKRSAGIKSDSTDRMPEPKKKPGRPAGSTSKGSSKGSTPQVPLVYSKHLKQPAQTPTPMIAPSKIGIQKLREIFEEARNKKKLTVSDTSQYMILYDEWRGAKGDKQVKKTKLDALKALYKNVLYKK